MINPNKHLILAFKYSYLKVRYKYNSIYRYLFLLLSCWRSEFVSLLKYFSYFIHVLHSLSALKSFLINKIIIIFYIFTWIKGGLILYIFIYIPSKEGN